MKRYIEKSMRIISDLVSYCHAQGANEYTIALNHHQGLTSLNITCPIENMDPEALEELSLELSIPRQYEVEQNYWELSGEAELSGELTLVGMMIDKSNVSYCNGVLYIHAQRKD